VAAAEDHFHAGDATRATALLEESVAMARPGRDRARIHFRLASISWLDMRRVQGLSEQALQEVGDDAETRAAIHEHLAWVGIYRGDLAFAAEHTRASMDWVGLIADPAVRTESLSTFGMVEFLMGRRRTSWPRPWSWRAWTAGRSASPLSCTGPTMVNTPVGAATTVMPSGTGPS
jgi:hypothetical protein